VADWSLVGGDPAPGDPDQVLAFSSQLEHVADDASECLRQLQSIANSWSGADWHGDAADAFRESIGELPEDLGKLERSYSLAARALSRYARLQRDAQDKARDALQRAQAAEAERRAADHDVEQGRSDLGRSQRNLDGVKWTYARRRQEYERRRTAQQASGQVDPGLQALYAEVMGLRNSVTASTNEVGAIRNRVNSATQRRGSAEANLRAERSLADQARNLREESARRAAREVRDASDAGIKNRNWFERAVDWTTRTVVGAIEWTGRILTGDPAAWKQLLDVLKVISTVLSIASLLLGWVPILGQILTIAALVVAVVVLIGTLVLFANGKASGWDLAFAILDTALAVVGARGVTGQLGKALKNAGEQGTKAVLAAAAKKQLQTVVNKAITSKVTLSQTLKVMKNPSVESFKRVVVLWAPESASTLRRIKYGDQLISKQASALAHAKIINGKEISKYLLKRSKSTLEYAKNVQDHGVRDASWNTLQDKVKGRLEGLEPTGAAKAGRKIGSLIPNLPGHSPSFGPSGIGAFSGGGSGFSGVGASGRW